MCLNDLTLFSEEVVTLIVHSVGRSDSYSSP